MPSMTVKLLPIAQDDVDQALAYIAADNPDAADVLLEDILKKLAQAAEFPGSGAEIVVGKRVVRTYYRLCAHPYNIFYRIMGDAVLVMRVLHERMDLKGRL